MVNSGGDGKLRPNAIKRVSALNSAPFLRYFFHFMTYNLYNSIVWFNDKFTLAELDMF